MHRTALVLPLSLVLGLAACGGDDDPEPRQPAPALPSASAPSTAGSPAPTSGAPTSPGTTSAAPSASPDVPFPANTEPDVQSPGGQALLAVTDVRTGRQDGYDRIVFELTGTGTPGWDVRYVDVPVQDGSGDPVALSGEVFLSVVLRGIGLPDDVGVPSFGDSTTRIAGEGTAQVVQVAPGSVFEGQQQAYVGLNGPQRPFRAFALSDPPRVVVDVRDS